MTLWSPTTPLNAPQPVAFLTGLHRVSVLVVCVTLVANTTPYRSNYTRYIPEAFDFPGGEANESNHFRKKLLCCRVICFKSLSRNPIPLWEYRPPKSNGCKFAPLPGSHIIGIGTVTAVSNQILNQPGGMLLHGQLKGGD